MWHICHYLHLNSCLIIFILTQYIYCCLYWMWVLSSLISTQYVYCCECWMCISNQLYLRIPQNEKWISYPTQNKKNVWDWWFWGLRRAKIGGNRQKLTKIENSLLHMWTYFLFVPQLCFGFCDTCIAVCNASLGFIDLGYDVIRVSLWVLRAGFVVLNIDTICSPLWVLKAHFFVFYYDAIHWSL